MIVDNDLERIKPLKQSLIDTGYEVIAHLKESVNLDNGCRELQPDIVIIDTDSPNCKYRFCPPYYLSSY